MCAVLQVNTQFFNVSYYKNGTHIVQHSINHTSGIHMNVAPFSSQLFSLKATYRQHQPAAGTITPVHTIPSITFPTTTITPTTTAPAFFQTSDVSY